MRSILLRLSTVFCVTSLLLGTACSLKPDENTVMDDHTHALDWARKSVEVKPTAERNCLLVTALINKSMQTEATAMIQQELKAGGPEALKFRQLLDQNKIPYKKGD